MSLLPYLDFVVLAHLSVSGSQESVNDLVRTLTAPNPQCRAVAARQLGRLGAEASDAVPALIRALNDELIVRSEAFGALTSIGSTAVPHIVRALREGAPKTDLLEALGEIGPNAREAMPFLSENLAKERKQVRIEIVRCLGLIGDNSAVPVLIERLRQDCDKDVQCFSASALGEIGSNAAAAIPVLIETLKRSRKNEKEQIANKPRRVGVFGMEEGNFHHPELGCRVCQALAGIGAPAVPAMTEILRNERDDVLRENALWVLGRIGPAASPSIEQLIESLNGTFSESTQALAVQALGAIGAKAKHAIPHLVGFTKGDSETLRIGSCFAILHIEPEHDEARSLILSALAEKSSSREMMFQGIIELADNAEFAIPALSRMLEDPDRSLRIRVLYLLRELGPTARAAVASIAKCLNDNDEDVRVAAVLSLPKTDEGPTAVKALTDALGDGSPIVRLLAANGLGEYGAKAKGSVPALQAATKDSDGCVRESATRALEKIGEM